MKLNQNTKSGRRARHRLLFGSKNQNSRSAQLLSLFLPAALLFLFVTSVAGTEVLNNRGFEFGSSGWTGYSPVTWGNYGVNNDFNCTPGGHSAFWVRGAWNWPQPNWMGNYQNLVSAPGCVYQATGSIYSP